MNYKEQKEITKHIQSSITELEKINFDLLPSYKARQLKESVRHLRFTKSQIDATPHPLGEVLETEDGQ